MDYGISPAASMGSHREHNSGDSIVPSNEEREETTGQEEKEGMVAIGQEGIGLERRLHTIIEWRFFFEHDHCILHFCVDLVVARSSQLSDASFEAC